jgi:AcrR family transcriptional regulator
MTQSGRVRNPRGAGDRLRQEIIEAATSLIGEDGPGALSLRAIARRAGVTAPAIYAHFDDLDAVRRAVVDSTFTDFAAYLRRSLRGRAQPADRLRALCRAYARFGLTRPREYEVMFGAEPEPPPNGTAKSLDTMAGAEPFSILLDAIRACVDTGESGSTRPVEDATAVWVALHGYVSLRSVIPDFPWPAGDLLVDAIAERLGCLRVTA